MRVIQQIQVDEDGFWFPGTDKVLFADDMGSGEYKVYQWPAESGISSEFYSEINEMSNAWGEVYEVRLTQEIWEDLEGAVPRSIFFYKDVTTATDGTFSPENGSTTESVVPAVYHSGLFPGLGLMKADVPDWLQNLLPGWPKWLQWAVVAVIIAIISYLALYVYKLIK